MYGGGGNIPPQINGIVTLNVHQFAALYHKKVIDKIIFPREVYFENQKATLTNLRTLDVDINDVYVLERLSENMNVTDFVQPYPTVRYLPHIEFRISEHCNLNCKMCVEYCPLVKEPTFMSLGKFTQDMKQLHKFIDDFAAIRILGGEPLLNPEVTEYMKVCRELYPVSPVHLVTNAILLPKMSDEFFDTVRDNNIIICISFYPPMKSKMQQIAELLQSQKVMYRIGGYVQGFFKNQTLKKNNPNEIFKQCGWSQCHNLSDGKIAACYRPFVTKYFNAYYNKGLPEDGALNLYEEGLTTEKLKAHLLKPFERCSYCTSDKLFEWGVVSKESPITDWIID